MARHLSTLLVNIYSIALELLRMMALPIAVRTGAAARHRLKERLRLPYPTRIFAGHSVVWLHAASLGEAKLMVRFMGILRRKHPDDLYVVTATSVAGVNYLHLCKNDVMCAIGFMPYDTVSLMKRMVDRFSIKRVWLMETELWPSMLWVCAHHGIPVGVANGRLEERSLRRYRLMGALFSPLFKRIDIVLAQDEEYGNRFEQLGVPEGRIKIAGNLKSRVSIQRPGRERWSSLREALRLTENDIVVTAGCIHPGEAEQVRDAISGLAKSRFSVKWIIVPRHLERAPAILEVLDPQTLHIRDERVPRTWDVCLVERYGVLEDMYSIADGAVLGGTFVDVGGHNVWEAAQFGIPVFFGPDYHTQRESCERLLEAGVGFAVDNGAHLAEQIKRTMKADAAKFIAAQRAFMRSTQEELGALEPLVP